MTELVELSSEKHRDLRVRKASILEATTSLHAMTLRAGEIPKAVCNFPVFFARNARTGHWNISAITSFEPGHNLLVNQGKWDSTFQPAWMQTYPLHLMQSPKSENDYTIGIDETSSAFSKSNENTEPLFDNTGKASIYLSRVSKLLETDIKNEVQSYRFIKALEDAGLLKAIEIVVHYSDETTSRLRGLHTIDEEKLQSLTKDTLETFNSQGYLAPIYSVLISIYQLNLLIKKNNEREEFKPVKQIKLELVKN